MADANCFERGDPVSWHYRSAIGHGYVKSVARQEDTCADTLFNVRQVDNHPGEPDTVQHTGNALSHSTRDAVEAAAEAARQRDEGKGRPVVTKIKSLPTSGLKAGPDDGLAEGEFLAYPATFIRKPDSYGDVVAKGAFLESIKAWKDSGDVLPGMYLHDPNQIVAAATDMGEDDHGWWVKGKFDDTPEAQRIYSLVKGRRLSSLSFAYDVVDEGGVQLDSGQKANELRQVNVHEFSFLPKGFAANADTSVVAVKSLADAVIRDLKQGRVLAGKHIDSLRSARDAISAVIAAAGDEEDDQGKASGKPAAKSDASDEEPSAAKSSVSDEEPKAGPSVALLAAQANLYALTGRKEA